MEESLEHMLVDKGPCLRVGDIISLWLFSSSNEHVVGLVVFDVDPGHDVIPYDGFHSSTEHGRGVKGDSNYVIFSDGQFSRLRHNYKNITFNVSIIARLD